MPRQRALAIVGPVLRGRRVVHGSVPIADGAVVERAPRSRTAMLPDGWIVAPGMVDLQVNGFGGAEVGDDPAAIEHIARMLPTEGVTAFCPTVVTRGERAYRRAAAALKAAGTDRLSARRLAPHLEGPFLNAGRAGAHRVDALRTPDADAVSGLLGAFAPAIVTLAPELPGGVEAVRLVRRAGAVPAVGHTEADAETARRAIDAGARLLTHAFNAMRGIETRAATALVEFLEDRRAQVSVIADGIHVDPQVLGLLARQAGARLVLVSDATASAGAPAGTFRLAGRSVRSDGRRATLRDGTLAGSARGLATGPATLVGSGLSGPHALAAASTSPRRLLGLPWRLRPGEPADLTVVDDALTPQLTVIGGQAAYRGPALPDRLASAFS